MRSSFSPAPLNTTFLSSAVLELGGPAEPPASAGSWADVSGAYLGQGGGCIPAGMLCILLRGLKQCFPGPEHSTDH